MDKAIVPVTSPRKEPRILIIDPECCKGCGFCIEFCPKGVLALSTDQFNAKGYCFVQARQPGVCIACGLCEMYCPDFAIYLNGPEPGPAAAEAATQSITSEDSHGKA